MAFIIWLRTDDTSNHIALGVLAAFKITAVLGIGYILYEVSALTEKRVGVTGVVLDAVLVLSMLLFWFAVTAATY